jgi:hypothetical protein
MFRILKVYISVLEAKYKENNGVEQYSPLFLIEQKSVYFNYLIRSVRFYFTSN